MDYTRKISAVPQPKIQMIKILFVCHGRRDEAGAR